MTLISLSSTPRTGAPEEFDAVKVRTLIADYLGIDVMRVVDEAHFGEDLGADWLDRLELTILIEDESGVEINDADAEQIEVVGDLIRHIEIDTKERGVKISPIPAATVGPRDLEATWQEVCKQVAEAELGGLKRALMPNPRPARPSPQSEWYGLRLWAGRVARRNAPARARHLPA